MFPISDENRRDHITPVINYLLIAINVAVFLYQIQLGSEGAIQEFINRYGVIPLEIAGRQDLYTLLTSMFIHGGWAHIIGNMLFLWVFGDNVEDAFGHVGYLVFYLLTGLAASAAHIILNPGSQIPSVGASGAISGVLGAYLIFFGSNPIRVLIFWFVTVVPAWVMIGLWAVQQFMATYGSIAHTDQTTGGVAYAAHAGGFVAGLLVAVVLRGSVGRPEQRPATNRGRSTY
jgi:membrane associated rhomboid family serine protease